MFECFARPLGYEHTSGDNIFLLNSPEVAQKISLSQNNQFKEI